MNQLPPTDPDSEGLERAQRQVNVADNSGATQNSHNVTINANETHYHQSGSSIDSRLLVVSGIAILGIVAIALTVIFSLLQPEPTSFANTPIVEKEIAVASATALPPTATEDLAALAYKRCDAAMAIPDWQLAYEHCRSVFDIDPDYRDIRLRLAEIVTRLTPSPTVTKVAMQVPDELATTPPIVVTPTVSPAPAAASDPTATQRSAVAQPTPVEYAATTTSVTSTPIVVTPIANLSAVSAALSDAAAIATNLGIDPAAIELDLDGKLQRAQQQAVALGIDSARVRIDPRIGSLYAIIPAGEFTMGAPGPDDQQPVRQIFLDTFAIKVTEVTNAEYAHCVDAGGCSAPANQRWNDPKFAAHPVVDVTWSDADNYARWIGGQLPSEAQWEKACRGDNGNLYPWGDATPEQVEGNLNNLIGDTAPVPAASDDSSPYQIADMAGSVREWVNDWYWRFYYGQMPARNPQGPEPTRKHVIRGGAYNDRTLVTCVVRHSEHSETIATAGRTSYEQPNLGFRVALPVVQ